MHKKQIEGINIIKYYTLSIIISYIYLYGDFMAYANSYTFFKLTKEDVKRRNKTKQNKTGDKGNLKNERNNNDQYKPMYFKENCKRKQINIFKCTCNVSRRI